VNIKDFIHSSISGDLSVERQKEFLLKLNETGFSGGDIAEMVKLFYAEMPTQLALPGAIDLCGTGGSGLSRINTSTLNAIILAACGVPVAKHGNKAASGRFGSFDLLESLGLNIMADKKRLERLYDKLGLAFIFARAFHPAFKHFAQVRQEVGVKTIFNILGPLLNPAKPEFQIIGTSNSEDMQLMAEACVALGKKDALILNGSDGLDELTLSGSTEVKELRDGKIHTYTLKPEDFGFKTVGFSEIAGGTEAFNVGITQDILNGKCRSQHINLVLANVALSLKFMNKVESYTDGVELGLAVIEDGRAKKLLEQYGQLSHAPDILLEIAEHKRQEIDLLKKALPLETIKKELKKSDRDFRAAISTEGELNLIAEIKLGSPSQPLIYEGDLDVTQIAKIYEENGAAAISVLTDKKYFRGSYENLSKARGATLNTPLLMKDFILESYQVHLARYYGADAILLIVAILTKEQIVEYTKLALSLGMDALVEVHNERELKLALELKTKIVGVNNRDLHTMEVDTKSILKLRRSIASEIILVAESGYSPASVSRIKGIANAVLMGTALMSESDPADAIRSVRRGSKLFKACGIRSVEAATHCERVGVDMVGLNFVPASKRRIDQETARQILHEIKSCITVGVFQNQPLDQVNRMASDLRLDFVQLSGDESPEYCDALSHPVIKTIKKDDLGKIDSYSDSVRMFIVDGNLPGSGEGYDYNALANLRINRPFLVAGGVSTDNAGAILSTLPAASGLDVASGLESEGEVDLKLLSEILSIVKQD
jgi:anthranilate phosphoribosyltransferase